MRTLKTTGLAALVGCVALATGCDDIATAVSQNLAWGVEGLADSIVDAFTDWIVEGFVNGVLYGVQ